MSRSYNLALPFLREAARAPERDAVVVAGVPTSYGELANSAARIAGEVAPLLRTRRVGILATRSMEAYAGILGACMAGATYIPLNLKWPEERLIALLGQLDLDAIVADRNGAALLTEAVLAAAPGLVILADNAPEPPAVGAARFERLSTLSAAPLGEAAHVGPDHPGYVMFTSGSTGLPKGCVISAGSLDAYLAQSRPWTQYGPADRLAESCDVTFDLTVHNLFLALESGASLHLMSQLDLMAPARFIRKNEITVWMSVPTIANMMRAKGALQPGAFPSLRLSIFCGEPLPAAAARAWAAATPNGVVENIYGPTECTVIALRQRVEDPPRLTPGRDVVAIGKPYATMDCAILDASQNPLPPGAPGEIALAGPQVGIGYFMSPAQTEDRFRTIGGRRWYLTGDLGLQDADGVFHHLGRVDNQVKVKGNRIELEEVEAHLRLAAGSDLIAVVAWPVIEHAAQGLVAFVGGQTIDADAIRADMLKRLPRYMVPETVRALAALPVNVNGKVDRRALLALLDGEDDARRVA